MCNLIASFFIDIWGSVMVSMTCLYDSIFFYERDITFKDLHTNTITDVSWSYWFYRIISSITCRNCAIMTRQLNHKGIYMVNYKYNNQYRYVISHDVDDIPRHVENSIMHNKPFRPPIMSVFGMIGGNRKELPELTRQLGSYDEHTHMQDLLRVWDAESLDIQIIGRKLWTITKENAHSMKVRDLYQPIILNVGK